MITLRVLSVVLFLMALASPGWAAPSPAETASLQPSVSTVPPLSPAELRAAIAGLDRSDPATAYALALRREGRAILATSIGVVAGGLLVSAVDLMFRVEGDAIAPYLLGLSIPVGLGLAAVGLPATLASAKYLGWYVRRGPAPTHLARLRLMHRWSLDLLRMRRDAALIGLSCLGGAAVVSAIAWAERDSRGVNGGGDLPYNPMDAVTTGALLALTGAMGAASGVLAAEVQHRRKAPHRIFAVPLVSVAPVQLAPGRSSFKPPAASSPEAGLGLRFVLGFSGSFF